MAALVGGTEEAARGGSQEENEGEGRTAQGTREEAHGGGVKG